MTTSHAIHALISIINSGDMERAREFAVDNADALYVLRSSQDALVAVAHAVVRWGAPIVWPWGDRPTPTPAQTRLLVRLRSGGSWRASEDTIVVCLACGWARYVDGRLVAV